VIARQTAQNRQIRPYRIQSGQRVHFHETGHGRPRHIGNPHAPRRGSSGCARQPGDLRSLGRLSYSQLVLTRSSYGALF